MHANLTYTGLGESNTGTRTGESTELAVTGTQYSEIN